MKKRSNYRAAWNFLKFILECTEFKHYEVVRLEDLKRTLKVLEEKYIKGGETDEGLGA